MKRLLAALFAILMPALALAQATSPPAGNNTNVTATGSTTPRTLADRAADVVNVQDFGAKADRQILVSAFTIAAGNAALSSSTAMFSASMVGKAIIVGGAGAAGAALITSVSAFTDTTHVTLAAPATTALSAVSEYVVIGTDNSAAINAAAAVAKVSLVINATGGRNIAAKLVFPKGAYLTLSSINLANIKDNGLQVEGNGAIVWGATAGFPVIDALGSRYLRWNGLIVRGDRYAMPNVGIQIGRINTIVDSSDNHSFKDVTIAGYFTLAGFYNLNAEQTSMVNLQVYNSYENANAFSGIFDGINHFGLTSQFVTQNQPANAPQSFLSNTCVNCIFYGAGPAPLWISGTSNLQFIAGYAVNTSTTGPYYGAILYGLAAKANDLLNMDMHFEPNTITDSLVISGAATQTLTGLRYRDQFNYATTSIIKADTGVTAVTLRALDVNVGTFANESAGNHLFNTPALFAVDGDVYLPGAGHWNAPASYQGRLNLNGSTSYYGSAASLSFPTSLAVSNVTASGGVSGLTFTAQANYLIPGGGALFPLVAFTAPGGSGTQAFGNFTKMQIQFPGAIVNGGTGYVTGDQVYLTNGTAVAGRALYVVTAVAGVVTALAYNANGLYTSLPDDVVSAPWTTLTGSGSGLTTHGLLWTFGVSFAAANANIQITAPGTGYTSATATITTPAGVTYNGSVNTTTVTFNRSLSLGASGALGSPVVSTGALIDNSGVRQTLTSTYTVPANTSLVRFIQTGTLAASTVTLPTAVADGQPVQFVSYAGTVTALTFSPAVAGWTNGSTLAANSGLRVRWDATSVGWFREQ